MFLPAFVIISFCLLSTKMPIFPRLKQYSLIFPDLKEFYFSLNIFSLVAAL